jgi:hypothetical protein
MLGEEVGRTDRPCRVYVVPTGVHHTRVARGVGEGSLLLDRESVDVSADRDRWAAAVTPPDARHDPSLRNTVELHGAERRERRVKLVGCAMLLE